MEEKIDIAITHYISESTALVYRLKQSNLFHQVYLMPEIKEYQPENFLKKLFFLHLRNKRQIETQLLIPLIRYKNIYIFP